MNDADTVLLPTELNDPAKQALAELSSKRTTIATLKKRYADLPAIVDTKTRNTSQAARQELRAFRIDIDKRGKELREDALRWQRAVISEVKSLVGEIEVIEEPIDKAIKAFDDAKEAEARKKAEEARLAMEAKIKADREAEEARLKAIRDAEEARLKAEADRIAAEKAEFLRLQKEQEAARRAEEEERRKKEMAERAAMEAKAEEERKALAEERRKNQEFQAKLEAERKAIEEEKLKVEESARVERERLARIEWEKAETERIRKALEEKAKAEKEHAERQAAHQRELEEIRQREEAKEKARIEAAKPDQRRLKDLAAKIYALLKDLPELKTEEAKAALNRADAGLCQIAKGLDEWKPTKKGVA